VKNYKYTLRGYYKGKKYAYENTAQIRIDRDMHSKVKKYAVQNNTSIKEIVDNLINNL
jgi:hypothetical protein